MRYVPATGLTFSIVDLSVAPPGGPRRRQTERVETLRQQVEQQAGQVETLRQQVEHFAEQMTLLAADYTTLAATLRARWN